MVKRLCLIGLVVGCGQSVEPVDSGEGDTDDTSAASDEPCSGSGSPAVSMGSGGRVDFVAYEEGALLALTENSSGIRGFWLESMVEGIDMREAVNVVYRLQIDGGSSEDYLTRIGLVCDDLEGWTKGFFEFDESIDTSTLDGAAFELTAVFTTDTGEVAQGEITLTGNPLW